jgi:hypothetical protein
VPKKQVKKTVSAHLEWATLPADALTIPAWNPQIHDRKNIEDIKVSIKEFGYVDPIIVRKSDGLVIGGAGRLMALRELWAEGWQGVDPKAVPVVLIECDDVTAKKISLALNKIQSQPDLFLLSSLMQSLIESGETVDSLTPTGYQPFVIEDLLNIARDIANHIPATTEALIPNIEPVKDEEPEPKEKEGKLTVERRFKIPLTFASVVDEQISKALWFKGKKQERLGMALVTIAKVASKAPADLWESTIKELMDEVAQSEKQNE